MSVYRQVHVALSRKDRRRIGEMLSKGRESARVLRRAWILRQLDQGQSAVQAAVSSGAGVTTVRAIARRCEEQELDAALYEKPRPGKQRTLNVKQSQRIVAMVCSAPPEGRARRTVRLIAAEAARRKLAPPVGRETIRILLQSHDLKPWREKNVVCGRTESGLHRTPGRSAGDLRKAALEERTGGVRGRKAGSTAREVRPPRPMRPGQILRRDCEYERRGTANAFCGVEPRAGRHFTRITANRSAEQFADYLVEIVAAYPEADTIHLVMDNLNSHRRKALVDRYGETIGGLIWDRFTVHYTPKHGSWLNQAEIEISLFSRQCLGRRSIPTLTELRRQARTWDRKMNQEQVRINWQFTRRKARRKFRYETTDFIRSET
jgi:transposase